LIPTSELRTARPDLDHVITKMTRFYYCTIMLMRKFSVVI